MDPLLEPISDAAPCGVDLSFDPVYNDLAVLMEGTPENQFEPGSAKEPNWRAILKLAEESLRRSKDLQIAIYYTVALSQVSGIEGAAQGMELIAGIARKYWETLFPNLDPEDPDPTQRVNILSQLTVEQGSFGDPIKFIERLNATPVFRVSGVAVSMVFLTQETAPGAGTGATRLPEMMAAANMAEVETGIDALRRTVAAVHALDDYLIATVGRNASPSFDPLIKVLDKGLRVFDSLSGVPATPDTAPAAANAVMAPTSITPSTTLAAGPSISGEIRSLDDVRAALAKIRDFYAVSEPSSPVPFLLLRAERLVGKNFVDLLNNLVPGSRSEFATLMGPDPE